jgi:hypothetical protein
MFARGGSKERSSTRKVTPPAPSYMSNEQFGTHAAFRLSERHAALMARPVADHIYLFLSRVPRRPSQ